MGRIRTLALTTIAVVALAAPASADAKRFNTKHSVELPAAGDVSVGVLQLSIAGKKKARAPKLRITGASRLPSTITVYAGIGKGRKPNTFLASVLVFNSAPASARAAQSGADLAMIFAGFQKAKKGKIAGAANILKNQLAHQQMLAACKRGGSIFNNAIAYLQDKPKLGALINGLAVSAVTTAAKKKDCDDVYNQITKPVKPPPGPGPGGGDTGGGGGGGSCPAPSARAFGPFAVVSLDCVIVDTSLRYYNPYEVLILMLVGEPRSARALTASTSPIDLIRVDPAGDRQITNQLCPSQLPSAAVVDGGKTLECSGGSLPLNTQVQANLQTDPAPTTDMGAQVYARQDGVVHGPFTATGPAPTCEFSYSGFSGSQQVSTGWRCSDQHSAISFVFNQDLDSVVSGSNPGCSKTDTRTVTCTGSFPGWGSPDGDYNTTKRLTVRFVAPGTCSGSKFVATATFTSGSVTLPEQSCVVSP